MPATRRSKTSRVKAKNDASKEQSVATKKQANVVKNNKNDSEVEYEVEQIIAMDKTGGKWMYLVSWVGYDDVTWEPTANIPASTISAYRLSITKHNETCSKSSINQICDMVDGAKNECNLWLFQVSWVECDHLTWEPEDSLDKSIVAAFRAQLESAGDASQNMVVDESVSPLTKPFDMVTVPGSSDTSLGKRRRVCAATDLSISDLEPMVENELQAKGKPSSNALRTDAIIDTKSATRQKTTLASVSKKQKRLNGLVTKKKQNTKKPTAASGSSETDPCAFCGQKGDLNCQCARCQWPMHRVCSTRVCQALEIKDPMGANMLDFPDDLSYCSGPCYKSIDSDKVCTFCGDAGALGSKCAVCGNLMHHFCATSVCTALDLTDLNGNKVVEFPNDVSYCSGYCYESVGVGSSRKLAKRKRLPIASDSSSDFCDGDLNLDDSESEDEDDYQPFCKMPVKKTQVNMQTPDSIAKSKSKHPVTMKSPRKPTLMPKARVAFISRAEEIQNQLDKRKEKKTKKPNPIIIRDPMVGKMVAFSADHEDWMVTTWPSSQSKKKKKSPPYEKARGMFLLGRTHQAKVARDDKTPERKYEVRWTQTAFQTTSHIHRLTLAQVERGMKNHETLARGQLSRATFDHICKVPASEVLDVGTSLDDYVVLDGSADDILLEQIYPENLQVVEQLKTLDFQPSRKMEAPKDLFTHDDGSFETKIKKDKSNLFQTASSSFFAYLPIPFWKSVVEQTNLYAADDKGAAVTLEELMKVFGIMFYMTVVSKGEYGNYWGEQVEGSILGVGKIPGLESVMSKKRFQFVRKNLCFRHNIPPEDLKRDPAARIRPLINTLKTTCPMYVNLGRNVAVDESSIACRSKYGRHLIVYNATKPTGKYHFKIYACCCATSWVMVGFRLHCSSEMSDRLAGVLSPTAARQLEEDTAFSSDVRTIVLEVTKPLHHTGRIVNTDNFYTSVQLLMSLKSLGMYGRGTVKESSLHFPRAHMLSKKSDEARGSSMQGVSSTERIVAASWRDGTTVNVISNADPSAMGEVTRLVGREHRTFAAPACIAQYNKHMQGVDRLDQLRAKYSIADGHSMKKWHMKLALALVDIARVNAYVTKQLRHDVAKSRNSHRDFMIELASELISGRWKETVDDGGFFISSLVTTPTRRHVVSNDPTAATTPTTPTTPTSPCTFALSCEYWQGATKGKRGCKVCTFEGRPSTMLTVYCFNHNVCLCVDKPYPIRSDLAILVCPNLDWDCWRKYHEWYLPKGLFNHKGHIKRSSKLHIARRLVMDENPDVGNYVTTSIVGTGSHHRSESSSHESSPLSSQHSGSPHVGQRSGSPHSSLRSESPHSIQRSGSPHQSGRDKSGDYTPTSTSPHLREPSETSDESDQSTSPGSELHNDDQRIELLHGMQPLSASAFTSQSINLTQATPSNRSVSSSPFESERMSFQSMLSPHETAPIPTPSPPTLVGRPFDGESENAMLEATVETSGSPQDLPPVTPGMSVALSVVLSPGEIRSSSSADFVQ